MPPPRRIGALRSYTAEHTWVEARVAQAILQIANSQLSRLAESGRIRREKKRLYNLGDLLNRYKLLLRASGAIEEHVESACVREFEEGLLPQEVIIKHGFGAEAVLNSWKMWNAIRNDPVVTGRMQAREDDKQSDELTRCKTCLRTAKVRNADVLRIVREVTGDPERESFRLPEERAFVDLDVRCATCRTLKASAPVETMRARFRKLSIMGEPQPIQFEPLPVEPGEPQAAAATVETPPPQNPLE